MLLIKYHRNLGKAVARAKIRWNLKACGSYQKAFSLFYFILLLDKL